MKSKSIIPILFVNVLLAISIHGITQQWHWDWAQNTNDTILGPYLDIVHADMYNNYYFRGGYSSFIQLPDTSFSHSVNSNTTNFAIARYNTRGVFMDAVDFYTVSNQSIRYPEVFTDHEMNMYVAGKFTYEIYFQDTLLSHCNTPYFSTHPDLFFVKLNADHEVVWADIIGGTLQDNLDGFVMSDEEEIFIASEHYAGAAGPTTVSFFEQDTAFYDRNFISISKIDKNKNLLWRNEFFGSVSGSMILGDDGNLHYHGHTPFYIIINGDTIHNPYDPNEYQPHFIISYNPDGELIEGCLIDNGLWIRDLAVTASGDYLVSGQIIDTLIVVQDTIIVPPEHDYHIIAKLDPDFEFLWYDITTEDPDQDFWGYKIKADQDNLVFFTSGKGEILIQDTLLNMGNHVGFMIGDLDNQGDLLNIQTVHSTNQISVFYPLLDNCSNPVVSGYFKNSAFFGDDTLTAVQNNEYDAYIAKLLRNDYETVDLGPDTIACQQFTIIGPANYQHYSWNYQLSNENTYTVFESGTYYFGCANDDECWLLDTIQVTIYPSIFPDLIFDTTMKENDTIVLSIPSIYDSYLWSNGSTSDSSVLMGSDFGVGEFPFWVEVTKGPCTHRDSITLTVKSAFGLDDLIDNSINLFPNPFIDAITIVTDQEHRSIEIFSLSGRKVYHKSNLHKNSQNHIDLKSLNKGIYFLKITTGNKDIFLKIIKM